MVPSATTVAAAFAPPHWAVSVSEMVPLGTALVVQLTPAVNVAGPASTTGFGVEITITTPLTWAGADGAITARVSKGISVATALTRILQIREFISSLPIETH